MTDINTTLEARNSTHGNFINNAMLSQGIKNMIRIHDDHKLSQSQLESLDMIAHKIARIVTGNPNVHDHWHDIAGYATLIANELKEL